MGARASKERLRSALTYTRMVLDSKAATFDSNHAFSQLHVRERLADHDPQAGYDKCGDSLNWLRLYHLATELSNDCDTLLRHAEELFQSQYPPAGAASAIADVLYCANNPVLPEIDTPTLKDIVKELELWFPPALITQYRKEGPSEEIKDLIHREENRQVLLAEFNDIAKSVDYVYVHEIQEGDGV